VARRLAQPLRLITVSLGGQQEKGMGPRILLVDDDIDLLDTLVRLLGRQGYTCRVASSGDEGIRAMEAESPDVVVTDLRMPGMDGLMVARHAQQHCPPIPVIVMTAYTTSETHQDVRRMGGTTYLTKPFANADLVNAVRRAVQHLET
jgi:two-component system nitrogen regulation response regulator GlnG